MGYQVESQFLSRLCGGEEFVWYTIAEQQFLSRLCGGEERALHG